MPDPSAPGSSPAADYFEFGPFRLEVSTRSLYLHQGDKGEFVAVPPKALDTLFVLVEEAGRLVTKDELMQRVWPDAFVEEGSIANNVSMLRKILDPHFAGDGAIATVSRRGYRFIAPVTLSNARAQISLHTESGRLTPEASAAIEEYVKANDIDARYPPPNALTREPPTAARGSWRAVAAVSIVIVAAAIAFASWRQRPDPEDRVVRPAGRVFQRL